MHIIYQLNSIYLHAIATMFAFQNAPENRKLTTKKYKYVIIIIITLNPGVQSGIYLLVSF